MPELPEVEHLRRTLEPALLGRRVSSVRLIRRDVVVRPTDPPGGFSRTGTRPATGVPRHELLSGQRIVEVLRHGKQLALVADTGRALCVHLGMSGALVCSPGPRAARMRPLEHVHCVWSLDAGDRLLFRDPRRFGGLWTFPSTADLRAARWDALGPDALTITARALHVRLTRTARCVKAALLDQSVIAGVGNIYADEALFLAGIHPARRADDIDPNDCARLARAIRETLRCAIRAGGSTIRTYADANGARGSYQSRHHVYGRARLPCPRCSIHLDTAVLSHRTTVWCPSCQPRSCPQSIPTDPEAFSANRPALSP